MSSIREYVMAHELFCHHDHHRSYAEFDAARDTYDYRGLLGYSEADLITAGGRGMGGEPLTHETMAQWWPYCRTTGYGQAVVQGCRHLFGLEYGAETWPAVTEALRASIAGQTAAEVYHHYVHEQAQNRWTIHDGCWTLEGASALHAENYPETYRFTFRRDELFAMVDAAPIEELERFTERSILNLDDLVAAVNAAIDRFQATGKLAALKIGMAYQRDLVIGNPTRHEAERAFERIRSRKAQWDGVQQSSGAVDALASRALGDYLLHALFHRAHDDDLPVQIHTGYLAGNWGALTGTKASHLIPVLDRYRRVRFDLFHASWPWASEVGAIAKNYPNVWLDMCWAWTMNPSESARALSEWLDGVPFNKIFAYGADTGLPWCNMGYSLQAKEGVAAVLEDKVSRGWYDRRTAEEVADHILLRNGEAFFGLGREAGQGRRG
jgi:predicted TIM-barrel fold metal-dependent hydrolase